ncbi:hypothetical protein ACF0H5_016884 [Mactra antiquata]
MIDKLDLRYRYRTYTVFLLTSALESLIDRPDRFRLIHSIYKSEIYVQVTTRLFNMQQTYRCKINIFGGVFVTVNNYGNITYIHLRHFDGPYPTKRGVAIPVFRWKRFMRNIDDIKYKLTDELEFTTHIGGNTYVSYSKAFPGIDIRDFWLPEDELHVKPTKRGVFMTKSQFGDFLQLVPRINSYIPELEETELCHSTDSDASLRCKECNPTEWQIHCVESE